MKKQSAAYALALILGATSVLGGVTLPSFEQDASVVQAASPSIELTEKSIRKASVATSTPTSENVSDETSLKNAIENSETIVLIDDISCETKLTIPENKSVTLNLNGHNLKYTTNNNDIYVYGTLVLTGSGTTNCNITLSDNGTLTMQNGQCNRVILGDNSHFTMYGGTINGSSGAGVTLWENSSFTMINGTITNSHQEGVWVTGSPNTFIMNGGTIIDNAWEGVSSAGNFTMSGGKIIKNSGGGVNIYSNGVFSILNSPIIKDNTDDNNTTNVLMRNSTKIQITDKLSDEGLIGIYVTKSGDFTKNYGTHNGTTDPTKYFSSDRSDYAVSLNTTSGEAQLVKTSSSSSSSSSSNTTARSTSSSTTSRSTSSSSGTVRSSSSSSDDDDDSSSKSFSESGTKTGGSGSSKGDYKKAGKTSAKYTMTDISGKATTATVPATVKIGKKTYNVTAISSDAFIGYSNLKTVTIGKNIKKIGKSAFSGCSSLKTLTINSKKLTAKNIKGALKGSAVKTVYVPADKVQAYKKIFTKKITGSKNKITVKAIKS